MLSRNYCPPATVFKILYLKNHRIKNLTVEILKKSCKCGNMSLWSLVTVFLSGCDMGRACVCVSAHMLTLVRVEYSLMLMIFYLVNHPFKDKRGREVKLK